MAKHSKLTGTQRRFADEYLVDCNATRAYKTAGYSPKNDNVAHVQGSRLLRNPNVASYISKRQKAMADKLEVTQERVVQELARLGFSSVDDYQVDDHGLVIVKQQRPADAVRALAAVKRRITRSDADETIETEFKLWDKPAALRMLGQHLGMFVERHEHTVSFASVVAGLRRPAEPKP